MHYDYDDYCNDFYENIDMENNDIAVAIFLSHHDTQEPVDTHNVEDKKQKTTSKTPPNNINARGVTMLKARYVQATILLKNQVEQQQGSEEFNIVNESNPTSAKFRPTKTNDETNQETTTNQQQANQLRSERLKDRNRKQCSFQIVTLLRNQLRRQILKDRNRHYMAPLLTRVTKNNEKGSTLMQQAPTQQPSYKDSKTQQQKKKPPPRKQQRMMQLMHHGHLASAINQRRSERLKDRNRGYSKYNNALSNQRRSQILKDRNRGHISNDVINNKQ